MIAHSETAARRAQSSNGGSVGSKAVASGNYHLSIIPATSDYPVFAIAGRFGLTLAVAAEVCRMANIGGRAL